MAECYLAGHLSVDGPADRYAVGVVIPGRDNFFVIVDHGRDGTINAGSWKGKPSDQNRFGVNECGGDRLHEFIENRLPPFLNELKILLDQRKLHPVYSGPKHDNTGGSNFSEVFENICDGGKLTGHFLIYEGTLLHPPHLSTSLKVYLDDIDGDGGVDRLHVHQAVRALNDAAVSPSLDTITIFDKWRRAFRPEVDCMENRGEDREAATLLRPFDTFLYPVVTE